MENTQNTIKNDFVFTLKSIYFNEDYILSNNTRATTGVASLARGESRQEYLRNIINVINNRYNTLANWDNPPNERCSIELEIISVYIDIDNTGKSFPL